MFCEALDEIPGAIAGSFSPNLEYYNPNVYGIRGSSSRGTRICGGLCRGGIFWIGPWLWIGLWWFAIPLFILFMSPLMLLLIRLPENPLWPAKERYTFHTRETTLANSTCKLWCGSMLESLNRDLVIWTHSMKWAAHEVKGAKTVTLSAENIYYY